MSISRRGALALPVLLAPAMARAQEEWPSRPIRIVVPFAAGGTTDIAARLVGNSLTQVLGKQVVVENRSGATTTIGAAEVARATPDGYTFLMAPPPFVIVQFAFPSLPYDPEKDFVPVAQVMSAPFVLAVREGLPVQNVAELIALAKRDPGKLTFATPGPGSLPHVLTEIFRLRTGTDMLHVPYRGGGPAAMDMAGGRVDLGFLARPEAEPHVQSGRVRLIGVSSPEPTPLVPGVAPIAATVPGFQAEYWAGLMAPAGVPQRIVTRMHEAVQTALTAPEFRQRMTDLGAAAAPKSTADFAALIASERVQFREAVAAANIRVQ